MFLRSNHFLLLKEIFYEILRGYKINFENLKIYLMAVFIT